jgi:putative Holliday junction resolvase
MRILAVDPGSKNIGVAISDPTGTIANPLTILKHVSREIDAGVINRLAAEHGAERIIVGQSLDENGVPTFEGRQATRLAAEIRTQTKLQVALWDESFSTREAQAARRKIGSIRKKRTGHLDDLAATVILQSYLDSQHLNSKYETT